MTHTFPVMRVEQPQVGVEVWHWQVKAVPVEAPFVCEAKERAVCFKKDLVLKRLLQELAN